MEQNQTLRAMLVCDCNTKSELISADGIPSQVINLKEKIQFVSNIESFLTKRNGLNTYHEQLFKTLQELSLLRSLDDSLQNLKVTALILDTICNRDILKNLITKRVRDTNDWSWQKQMRYYISRDVNCNCVMRMSSAQLEYTFEYQGNQEKLIHTPLTDKCYLALMLGLRFGFSGNLCGPAGTGKTETVKSLGATLGRRVLVFNCDEGIDLTSLSRIFIGLVQSGSWGCFDEFNRLKGDQLSAISFDIQNILHVLKEKVQTINFLGKGVPVNFILTGA